jgi:transposase-like protein
MPPSFLDPAERNDLWTRGVHGPDPVLARRARALLALDQGFTLTRAARLGGCNRTTLWDWRRRYLEDRVADSLSDRRIGTAAWKLAEQRLPARAAALWDLARSQGKPAPREGRLRLGRRDTERLIRAARRHPNPLLRFRAALLVAYDRGASIAAIAGAGCCCRSTVKAAPRRHLSRILEELRRQDQG